MPKVVVNSSPLIHMAKIGQLELLKDFYRTVFIPEAVFRECVLEGKGRPEAQMIQKATWIKRSRVRDEKMVTLLSASLDAGEAETITLASEVSAGLIALDDAEARESARLMGLRITGTLGILLKAKKSGSIQSLKKVIRNLRTTGFWISNALEIQLLKEAGE